MLTIGICATAVLLLSFAVSDLGRFLIVDCPEKSDVIVVLAGDIDDIRVREGLVLLRRRYADQLFLDAPARKMYGRSQAGQAETFLRKTAPEQTGRTHVCTFNSDSTRQELAEVKRCLQRSAPEARSGIIVTSSFHTRRALGIARRVMPEYHWSVAAVADPTFGSRWWTSSEYAKTTFREWQKLLFWSVIERWEIKTESVIGFPDEKFWEGSSTEMSIASRSSGLQGTSELLDSPDAQARIRSSFPILPSLKSHACP